ncbi:MAG: pilus assembly protein PilM [Patescibacteria group bacterium]
MAATPIGIDIGEKYTRIIDLTFTNGKIDLSCIGIQPTVVNFFSDDGEKSIENQADVILKLCSDLKISKKSANICIPDSQSFSQILEFAKLNEKELLSAVKYQSDQFIPMAIEDVVLDIEILKENKAEKKNTILIVASPKKLVDRVEKAVEMSGLIPESLENELSSFGRFFSEVMKKNGEGAFLVVNFGYTSTSIYLIDSKSSIILLTRTVKVGFHLFLKELHFNFELQESKSLEILRTIGFQKNASYDISSIVSPIMKELLNELAKFLVYSKEKYGLAVSNLYVFNYSPHILSFEKKLSEALSLPVEPLYIRDLLVNNPVSQSFSNDMPSYICAIGSSIR